MLTLGLARTETTLANPPAAIIYNILIIPSIIPSRTKILRTKAIPVADTSLGWSHCWTGKRPKNSAAGKSNAVVMLKRPTSPKLPRAIIHLPSTVVDVVASPAAPAKDRPLPNLCYEQIFIFQTELKRVGSLLVDEYSNHFDGQAA